MGTARAARVPADRTTPRRRFAVVALIEVEDGVTHEAIYQRIATLNADGLREVYLDVDPDWAHEVLRENAELDVEAATS